MKRIAALLLALLALAMTGIACAETATSGSGQSDGEALPSVDQLNGKLIGSATGATYDEIVLRRHRLYGRARGERAVFRARL